MLNHRPAQGLLVVRRHKEAGLWSNDHLGVSSDSGSNDRQTSRRCLQQDHREDLPTGRAEPMRPHAAIRSGTSSRTPRKRTFARPCADSSRTPSAGNPRPQSGKPCRDVQARPTGSHGPARRSPWHAPGGRRPGRQMCRSRAGQCARRSRACRTPLEPADVDAVGNPSYPAGRRRANPYVPFHTCPADVGRHVGQPIGQPVHALSPPTPLVGVVRCADQDRHAAEQTRHPAQQVRVHHVAVDHVGMEPVHCTREPNHASGVGNSFRHAETDDLDTCVSQLLARRLRDPAGTPR